MIVEKITRRYTKALIAFFLQTPQLGLSRCPVVELVKQIASLFGSTRMFVIDSTELNRQYFVKDLDKVTHLCLKLSPNKNVRTSVRAVTSTFRDTVLLDEESDSDESCEYDIVKQITEQK